ncbi:hypothetical protein GCM10023259_069240 [Thermocatellispora tengchongensis]
MRSEIAPLGLPDWSRVWLEWSTGSSSAGGAAGQQGPPSVTDGVVGQHFSGWVLGITAVLKKVLIARELS